MPLETRILEHIIASESPILKQPDEIASTIKGEVVLYQRGASPYEPTPDIVIHAEEPATKQDIAERGRFERERAAQQIRANGGSLPSHLRGYVERHPEIWKLATTIPPQELSEENY